MRSACAAAHVIGAVGARAHVDVPPNARVAKRRAAAKSAASKLPTAVKLGDGPTSAAQRGADWSASHNK